MDERVRRHAETLVEYCTEIESTDNVLITAPVVAEELVVALYEKLGERGARPRTVWSNGRASRAYQRAMAPEAYRTSEHVLAAMKETDVVILVGGATNTAELSDVDPKTRSAASRASEPILRERLDKRWVITQHPTPAAAQQAGMSTAAWTDLVYNAVDTDWDAQQRRQERVVEVLDPATEVQIVTDDTDLRMSIDGMTTVNDAGKKNMPGGEVATSPVVDSVEGTLFVDLPFVENGHEIDGVRFEFEDGEVVDCDAGEHQAVLDGLLDTDDGARRVGELGIGMNRGIDRFTTNMLFDEKIGGTIHVALGEALQECVPDDRAFNESARHRDMLVEMGEHSHIEVDGELIQQDGVFWFEDEFNAW